MLNSVILRRWDLRRLNEVEHTFLKWILGVALGYAIFILIWHHLVRDPPGPRDNDKKP